MDAPRPGWRDLGDTNPRRPLPARRRGRRGFAAASGYQEDGDSGLKLLGHRYCDPSAWRFHTRDVARDGRNWYAYIESNPLKATVADADL